MAPRGCMVIFACLFRSGILAQARYTAEGGGGGGREVMIQKQQEFLLKLCGNYKKNNNSNYNKRMRGSCDEMLPSVNVSFCGL
jgi:hypothetical protein